MQTILIIIIILMLLAYPITKLIGKAWHKSFLEEIQKFKGEKDESEK
jgi:hypothetical protein